MGAHYLLGQVIRQYAIPDANHYISEAAGKLWVSISDDNIWNYVYVDKFEIKCDYVLPRYVGSEKDPREKEKSYQKGDKVKFNSVFHDEHIISIKEIINQLDSIPKDELNYDNVKSILDKMTICRILKKEDKTLPHKRFDNFDDNNKKMEIVNNDLIYA